VLTDHTSSQSSWVLRAILWSVALIIIFMLVYKIAFRKQVEQRVNCLDRAASAEPANSPLTSVNKYAACIGRTTLAAAGAGAGVASGASGDSKANTTAIAGDTRPARCRYVGSWDATRAGVTYQVSLDVDGRFIAEPGANAPPSPSKITGAWSAAGNVLVWVYDTGPVWPPDINPVSEESADGFTLREVNGSTTRYTLVERSTPALCAR
jgi:hypothetical protein